MTDASAAAASSWALANGLSGRAVPPKERRALRLGRRPPQRRRRQGPAPNRSQLVSGPLRIISPFDWCESRHSGDELGPATARTATLRRAGHLPPCPPFLNPFAAASPVVGAAAVEQVREVGGETIRRRAKPQARTMTFGPNGTSASLPAANGPHWTSGLGQQRKFGSEISPHRAHRPHPRLIHVVLGAPTITSAQNVAGQRAVVPRHRVAPRKPDRADDIAGSRPRCAARPSTRVSTFRAGNWLHQGDGAGDAAGHVVRETSRAPAKPIWATERTA